jgi:phage I-like protein
VVETTDAATATTAIATLKAKADKAGGAATDPDPTKWVSLDNFNTLSAEVAALRASGVHREVDELVAQATADGKCAGVVADVWRDVGKKDIAAGGDGGDTLSVDEIAVCSATGITREDFLKTRKAAAAATA